MQESEGVGDYFQRAWVEFKAPGKNLAQIPMLLISVLIMLHQELMKGPLSVFSITEP